MKRQTFLLIVASKKVIPNSQVIVNHHISGGYFCEFLDHAMCTKENILAIESEMRNLVNKELPITKQTVPVDEAIRYFEENIFDRLLIAAVSYSPEFKSKIYNRTICG